MREDHAAVILLVSWMPGEFSLVNLFTKTTIPGNTSEFFVDSIFSNTASLIGGI